MWWGVGKWVRQKENLHVKHRKTCVHESWIFNKSDHLFFLWRHSTPAYCLSEKLTAPHMADMIKPDLKKQIIKFCLISGGPRYHEIAPSPIGLNIAMTTAQWSHNSVRYSWWKHSNKRRGAKQNLINTPPNLTTMVSSCCYTRMLHTPSHITHHGRRQQF